MRTRSHCVFPAFLLALILAGTAKADAFRNGSFELGVNPPPAGNFNRLLTGDTSITGWAIQGRVDWVDAGYAAGIVEDGQRAAELVSDARYNNGLTTLSETFDTAPSETYAVSFYAAPSRSEPHQATIHVNLTNNGVTQTETFVLPVVLTPDFQYHQYFAQFTTASGTTSSILSFDQSGVYNGPLIDNVTVRTVAVPLPSAAASVMVLMAGVVAARFVVRRRRICA